MRSFAPALGATARTQLAAIRAELAVLRPGTSALDTVMAPLASLLATELVITYGLRQAGGTLALERWHSHGDRGLARDRLERAIDRPSPRPVIVYDFLRPPPSQRNRFIEATAWINRKDPDAFAQSRMCREVMGPLGLGEHKQLRALVCDGGSLLAWFGLVQREPARRAQVQVLAALLPDIQRVLALERRLEHAAVTEVALSAALELLGAPAMLVGPAGRIHHGNAAARALLAAPASALRDAAACAARGQPYPGAEIVPLAERGMPHHALVVMRAQSADQRTLACLQVCSERWQLTRRQLAVLALVVRGHANARIASDLGVTERSIEMHVTAMFDRCGVDNRAGLVAAVLTAC